MAFSYGFYNSKDHDQEYDAVQISMIFDGLITDGVYATYGKSFIVKATTEENLVIVQSGRAWFNHTWNYNDAELPIKADLSELILDRIDALVIDVHSDEEFRKNDIIWVKGSPSDNPVRPELINTYGHYQYPLCYIYRRANTEVINQMDITNTVGSSECPFVTGILETIDIDELLMQWKDQWAQFVINYEKSAEQWTKEQQEDFKNFYNEFKMQLTSFEQASQKDFEDWFSLVQNTLDGDTAGHLFNLINEVSQTEFNHYYGLVNSSTVIDKTTNTITTTTSEGTSTTRFQNDENGNKMITTTVVLNSGNFDYVKTTTITDLDSEKRISTSFISRPK